MNIGITTFGCDAGRSGIGRYAIQLLRALDAVDTDAVFEVLLHKSDEAALLPEAHRFKRAYVSERFRHPGINVAWHQLGLARHCAKARYDVLFLPAGNRRVPFSAPCPVVGAVHDFASIHVEGKYDPLRMFYIKHVLPMLVRRLTHVITGSEDAKKDIVEFAGVPEDRVTVIPLGVDRQVYSPGDKEAARSRIGAKYGLTAPYVLYISRIEHPGKNHVPLIQAFSRLKETAGLSHQLLLIGSDWTRAEEVHAAAAASSCAKDIVFTGFASGADLPDLYRAADLFVFPSLFEGFGMPILEAMACGIPIACSNTSSLPEVAGDATLLFDPSNSAAMEDAMRRLLTDPDLRGTCVQKGLARSEGFDWATTARRTLAVLERAAQQGTDRTMRAT